MDTLHDRLAELADDAPTGGAPAAELWARGKRAHRLRAAALAATLLVVGAVGTGIGVRLADGDGDQLRPCAGGDRWHLAADRVPRWGGTAGSRGHSRTAGGDLGGSSRGRRRASKSSASSRKPGRSGRSRSTCPSVLRGSLTRTSRCRPTAAGSPISTPADELVVRDLVSGESYSPAFEIQDPPRGTPGSMPPTWSATLRMGPTG